MLACHLQNYAEDQRTIYEGYYKQHWGTWTCPTDTDYWIKHRSTTSGE